MSYQAVLIGGMGTLIGFGVASLAAPFWARRLVRDDQSLGFARMSQAWGAINVVIGVFGVAGLLRQPATVGARAEAYAATLRANAWLDLAYAGVGVALVYSGNRHGNAQLKGFGWAVIFQAVGLFLIDAVLAFLA